MKRAVHDVVDDAHDFLLQRVADLSRSYDRQRMNDLETAMATAEELAQAGEGSSVARHDNDRWGEDVAVLIAAVASGHAERWREDGAADRLDERARELRAPAGRPGREEAAAVIVDLIAHGQGDLLAAVAIHLALTGTAGEALLGAAQKGLAILADERDHRRAEPSPIRSAARPPQSQTTAAKAHQRDSASASTRSASPAG